MGSSVAASPGHPGKRVARRSIAASPTLKTTSKPASRKSSSLLGAGMSKAIPGSGETQLALLIVLLGAIVLLTVGALPRDIVPHHGAAVFVARRRALFVAGGLAALGAFLVSYFVT